ncbi:MAG: NAD(P)H-dependent glycerol-3-phosphate dehydrogenase [Chlorobi bacterium OLB5]|nr:MAG: NAD(P)H-dependent glycerol-3-phosphate dehydrogenase [Chlorobi bacterium OLB5]
MNICILGAGGWGTALGIILNSNKHKVTLWEYDKEYAHTINEYRENFYYLPKVKIPARITISSDINAAVKDKDLIVVATPTQFIRGVIEQVSDIDFNNRLILSVSKGIENHSLMTVSQIFNDVFKNISKKISAYFQVPLMQKKLQKKSPQQL